MNKEQLSKEIKDTLTSIPEANILWLASLEPWLLAFNMAGTINQAWKLRRYLHLNYPVSVLVQHTSATSSLPFNDDKTKITDIEQMSAEITETPTKILFTIGPRENIEVDSKVLDLLLFATNPQYDNTLHHDVPAEGQVWDMITLQQPSSDIDLLDGTVKKVRVCGEIPGYTHTQVAYMLKALGIELDQVGFKVDLHLIGTRDIDASFTKTVIKNCTSSGKPFLAGAKLNRQLDRISKKVYGSG